MFTAIWNNPLTIVFIIGICGLTVCMLSMLVSALRNKPIPVRYFVLTLCLVVVVLVAAPTHQDARAQWDNVVTTAYIQEFVSQDNFIGWRGGVMHQSAAGLWIDLRWIDTKKALRLV